MELKRFFVAPQDIVDGSVFVQGDEYVHMTAVLRFRIGYRCIVCDNSGMDYTCEVVAIDKSKATLRVVSIQENKTELSAPITLCLGVIKQEKMEYSIQKAVELGVTTIVPFVSRYTDEKRVRFDRANRIILESCKQCGRAKLPTILPVCNYQDIFATDCFTLFAYENEDKQKEVEAIQRCYTKNIPVRIVIGSEGGFAPDEVEYAKSKGAVVCSLGKRILRAETAASVAIGTFTALTEEL